MRRSYIVGALILCAAIAPSIHAADKDACALLSAADVSAALEGSTVTPAKNAGSRMCTWSVSGKSGGSPCVSSLTLTIMGQMGSLSPVERFERAKTPIGNLKKTPVSGVGDEAYLIDTGIYATLNVRKGKSVLQVTAGGQCKAPDQRLAALEALGRKAVARL